MIPLQELADQILYHNTIKMWVDDNGSSSVIQRGHWHYIDILCSTEKYFEASGSFNPVDASVTTVIFDDDFGEISLSLDFYTDQTFQVKIRRELFTFLWDC